MGGGWKGDAGSKLTRSGGVLCDWFGEYIWFSVVGPELEAGTKNYRSCHLLIKSWAFGAAFYRISV